MSRLNSAWTAIREFQTMRPMHGQGERIMRCAWAAATVAALSLFCLSSALATPNPEREALTRLIHAIEAFDPLIATAESEANPDARIRFRYDWLREDLKRVRRGIQDQIDAPCGTSPPVPSLRGDYRR